MYNITCIIYELYYTKLKYNDEVCIDLKSSLKFLAFWSIKNIKFFEQSKKNTHFGIIYYLNITQYLEFQCFIRIISVGLI